MGTHAPKTLGIISTQHHRPLSQTVHPSTRLFRCPCLCQHTEMVEYFNILKIGDWHHLSRYHRELKLMQTHMSTKQGIFAVWHYVALSQTVHAGVRKSTYPGLQHTHITVQNQLILI